MSHPAPSTSSNSNTTFTSSILSSAATGDSTSSRASSSTSSTPAAAAAAGFAVCCCDLVLQILCGLVQCAHNDFGMAAAAQRHVAPNDKATALEQQIQAAGFLQLLPQLFDFLVQRLQADTGITTQLKPVSPPQPSASAQQQQQQQQGPASTSSDSSSQRTPENAAVVPCKGLSKLLQAALRTYDMLSRAWPPGVFVMELAFDATAPVLRLCRLALQYAHLWLQAPPITRSDGRVGNPVYAHMVWAAADQASDAAVGPSLLSDDLLAACDRHKVTQHLARVRASPCALPCVMHSICVGVYSLLLAQLPTLPRACKSAGGGGGSSSTTARGGGGSIGTTARGGGSSGTAARGGSSSRRVAPISARQAADDASSKIAEGAAAALELACKEVDRVPTSHCLLLNQLGSSPLSAVFLAACSIQECGGNITAAQQDMASSRSSTKHRARCDTAALVTLWNRLSHAVDCFRRLQRNHCPAGVPRPEQPLTPAEQQMYALLSPVLMYFAAHQPTRVGQADPANCHNSVSAAASALNRAIAVDSGCPESLPAFMLQLLRDELTPLASVVVSSVLGSLGCGVVDSSAGSSSSGSNGKSSKRATATSSEPMETALHLVQMFSWLVATAGREVMLGQLMEVAVRGWQQAELPWESLQLWEALQCLVCRSPRRESNDGHMDSSSSSSRRGCLLAAAQVQSPHTSSNSGALTPAQLQLASLCFSVLKMLSGLAIRQPDVCASRGAGYCCHLVAMAINSMLCWLATRDDSATASAAVAESSNAQQSAAAAAPWLVLSGRFLQFAASLLSAPAADLSSSGSDGSSDNSTAGVLCVESRVKLQGFADTVASGLHAWLQSQGADEALSAAGYDPSGSLQQQLLHAVGNVAGGTGSSSGEEPATIQLKPEAMRSLGRALNTLPLTCACNNPGCSNLAGTMEAGLATGKSCVWGGCLAARFCSRACLSGSTGSSTGLSAARLQLCVLQHRRLRTQHQQRQQKQQVLRADAQVLGSSGGCGWDV